MHGMEVKVNPLANLAGKSCNRDSARKMDENEEGKLFHCVICMDLAYKPIVQACGHVFCFWCVHQAMSADGISHCPLCRSPYKHFPRVCELLHYLLLKAFPEDYNQRAEEVLEMENCMGAFSPQLGDPKIVKILDASKLDSSASIQSFSGGNSPKNDSVPDSAVTSKKHISSMSLTEKKNDGTTSIHMSFLCHQSTAPNVETSDGMYNVEANNAQNNVASNTKDGQENAESLISQDKVTADDALCCQCKELIYHPVVLNCGHAFCELCTNISEDRTLKCQVCQTFHPGDRLGVCLELDQFLERTFTIEYAERKMSVLVNNKMRQQCKEESTMRTQEDGSATAETPENPSDQIVIIHPGAGCDYCGIYPITGKRYKCLDCPESTGFDLCETCYETGARLPGRFNQQHTAEHRFEVLPMDILEQELLGSFPDITSPFS